jgi:hypothetical protein
MNTEIKIHVTATFVDGRAYFVIKLPEDGQNNETITLNTIRMILTGAVAMTVRMSENDVEAMKQVIELLNEQFVSPDAFEDSKLMVPEKN